MKLGIVILTVLLSVNCFATAQPAEWESSVEILAIKLFKRSEVVKAKLKKLEATRVDEPQTLLLFAMGDGCDIMSSYLVIQKIKSESFFDQVVAARYSAETQDLQCAGKKGQYMSTVRFERFVNLRR